MEWRDNFKDGSLILDENDNENNEDLDHDSLSSGLIDDVDDLEDDAAADAEVDAAAADVDVDAAEDVDGEDGAAAISASDVSVSLPLEEAPVSSADANINAWIDKLKVQYK